MWSLHHEAYILYSKICNNKNNLKNKSQMTMMIEVKRGIKQGSPNHGNRLVVLHGLHSRR